MITATKPAKPVTLELRRSKTGHWYWINRTTGKTILGGRSTQFRALMAARREGFTLTRERPLLAPQRK